MQTPLITYYLQISAIVLKGQCAYWNGIKLMTFTGVRIHKTANMKVAYKYTG